MPPKRGPPRFVADAMLGSLARKLRALGYPTAYYREGDDAGLLSLSKSERLVVLTSDKALTSRAKSLGVDAILVEGRSDGRRLASIAAGASRSGITLLPGDSLCSLCGGTLLKLPRTEVTGKVPGSVENRHRLFFRCAICGHIYWRGSHWKKLRSLSRRLAQQHDDLLGGRKGLGRTRPGHPRSESERRAGRQARHP